MHEPIAMRVGEVEVVAITDGVATVDTPMSEAFPDLSPAEHDDAAARYPAIYGSGGGWNIFVRAWLIRHLGSVVLLDTGVGPATSVALTWFPSPGLLHGALAAVGTSADRIDTVVLSHVHDDHIGGTVTTSGEPAFPNARYLVQRADLVALDEWKTTSEEDRTIHDQMIAPIRSADLLVALDGDHQLGEALQLRHAPGHTPGHQVLRVSSGGDRMLLSADTWNHPLQLGYPEKASATDSDPSRATATRRALLAELLGNPGTVLAPTHLPEPFGKVVTGPDGLAAWAEVPP